LLRGRHVRSRPLQSDPRHRERRSDASRGALGEEATSCLNLGSPEVPSMPDRHSNNRPPRPPRGPVLAVADADGPPPSNFWNFWNFWKFWNSFSNFRGGFGGRSAGEPPCGPSAAAATAEVHRQRRRKPSHEWRRVQFHHSCWGNSLLGCRTRAGCHEHDGLRKQVSIGVKDLSKRDFFIDYGDEQSTRCGTRQFSRKGAAAVKIRLGRSVRAHSRSSRQSWWGLTN